MSDKKYIISPEYPEGILVDLTPAEIAQREQDAIQAEQDRIAYEQKITQAEQRKQSAISKLKAIGLTDEEINSLLGK